VFVFLTATNELPVVLNSTMDGCSLQGIRPERTRWKREAMDQDNAGHRLVRIPHLRAGKARVRRKLEARRL
jgi:hypothetical protein